MKKVQITSFFIDKYSGEHIMPGQVLSFSDERAADMVARHLAAYVVEDKPKQTEAPTLFQEVKADAEKQAEEQKVDATETRTEQVRRPMPTKGKKSRV